MTFFVQSTCMTKWEGKQGQSGERWKAYLPELAPRGNFLVVPFCFRNPSGAWYDPLWVHGAVFVDRVRLLWLSRNVPGTLPHVPYDLVDAAREQRESVV